MIDDVLTEQIIGCAYRVYNSLGAGFLESVYKKALMIELESCSLDAIEEYPIAVFYKTHKVGSFYADILVKDLVILELKAVEALVKAHEVQLVNYLKATGIETGLLLNFGPHGLQLKRKFKDRKIPVNPANPVILSH